MNRIFDWIDKYKFGLIATVAAYIFIFSYLQMQSYTEYFPIEPFHDGPTIEKEEEIALDPENIEVPPDYQGDIKNISRDRNDKRERSADNWSQNQPSSGEQYAKDMEKKFFEETGGEAKRDAIRKQAEADRKKNEQNQKNAKSSSQNNTGTGGTNKAYAGSVMVDWELSDRSSSRLPVPGYMCGVGEAGLIVVDISVNQSGNVVSARYNSGASSSSNPCMVEQAKNYALKSRFNYSSSASNTQSGKIYYTFISQ
jgi:hypothetical protein